MEQPDIAKKQFIAGAVCPQCDAVDRIVVETAVAKAGSSALSRRRCVQCGFADNFATSSQSASQGVPKGRPERHKPDTAEPAVVRIMDPGEDRIT